jgi:hypothetical protein
MLFTMLVAFGEFDDDPPRRLLTRAVRAAT